jgi:hypothetical protein
VNTTLLAVMSAEGVLLYSTMHESGM